MIFRQALAATLACGTLLTCFSGALHAGADRLEGGETADYDWSGPAPAAYGNDRFAPSLFPASAPGTAHLRVVSSFAPLGSRTPWPIPAAKSPPELRLTVQPGSEGARLAAGSQTVYEAAYKILSEVKKRLRYDADGAETPGAALGAGRGNCVAFASLALQWLREAGIAGRAITGVYLPRNKTALELKGAALHRFIEIYFPDRGWVFTEPNRTFGAVTAEYIYLGPAGADYSRYEGVRITRRRLSSSLIAEKRGGEVFYSRANVRDILLRGDQRSSPSQESTTIF
jgi:hypothetical protein